MLRPLRRYQVVTDLVLAGAFGLLALAVELTVGTTVVDDVGATLTTLAFTAAVALRRLQPGAALTAAWVGAIVQMAFDRVPSPVDIAIFAVLYTTAAYGSRRVFWFGFGSSIVGAVVASFYLVVRRGSGALDAEHLFALGAALLATAFALLLAWVTGALVRTALRAAAHSRAQQAAVAATIAEQERVRIARDMHDVVAHSLAVVIAQADGARYATAAGPQTATDALLTISSTARAALSDVRLLLTQLRHSPAEGPQPTLADVETLYAQVRAAGLELSIDVDPAPPGEPPAAVQLAVYRILQEALTNALRHGADRRVAVTLSWWADRVDLSVRNARVMASGSPAAPGSHGLIGMRERAQLVGGRLSAQAEGGDFVVRASLPIGPST